MGAWMMLMANSERRRVATAGGSRNGKMTWRARRLADRSANGARATAIQLHRMCRRGAAVCAKPCRTEPRRYDDEVPALQRAADDERSEEHTSELQSPGHLVCRRLR